LSVTRLLICTWQQLFGAVRQKGPKRVKKNRTRHCPEVN